MIENENTKDYFELYKLNIEKIDKQHREWISIYYEIIELVNNQSSPEEHKLMMTIIVSKMYKYARFHLDYEEQFLKNIDYPLLEKHKKQHRVLDSQITEFFDPFLRDELIPYEKLTDAIELWIKNHIMDHDKKYADYIFENNIDYEKFLP